MKFYFLLIFTLLSIKYLNAQYAEFKHFSSDDGLASNEVYCQLQDSTGYMWFGTSRGLSRFDGYEFKNFTASDGLPSNSVIKMFYDKFNRLWFSNYDGSLSFFYKNKIHKYKFNDTIVKLAKNYYIQNLLTDKDSNIYIMPALGGIYKITPKGKIYSLTPKKRTNTFFIQDTSFGILYSLIPGQNPDSLSVNAMNNKIFISGIKPALRKNVIKINNKNFIFSIGKNLYQINNKKIIHHLTFTNEITGLFLDKNHNLWVSLLYNGINFYPNANLNLLPKKYLDKKTAIPVFQDHQNGYWLSTTQNGVFYTPSFQFISYQMPLFNIKTIKIINNKLYFSTSDRELIKLGIDNTKITSNVMLQLCNSQNSIIEDIETTKDSAIWFLGKELIRLKNNKCYIIDTLARSYKLFPKNNKIYVCSDKGLFIFNDSIHQFFAHKLPISNALFVDKNNNVWIGTINGLYKFSDNSFSNLALKNKLLKFRINFLTKYDKYIVAATNGNGIIFFDELNNKAFQLTEKKGLNSKFVNTIFIDGKNIWAGTNKGLCLINIATKNNNISFFTTQFSGRDGLYANDIKSIDKNQNIIFLGTSQGLISFDPNKLKKNLQPPELQFDSIKIINKKISINDTSIILKPKQNTITFYYKGISFFSGNKVVYRYKLKGYDSKWQITSDRFLRFPNLQPGKYTLYISSSSDGNTWNKKALKFHFKIKRKFTHTIFFYGLIIILFLISTLSIIMLRFNYLDKQLEQKNRIVKAEQKALRSQMNPHFIFNALNSIRRFILENDADNADFYLTSFAMLMRKVLENSKYENISLENEIETLKLYLELEKMRFDDTFNFRIEIDKEIHPNSTYIPTMIIQPVLENAIWHGLAPLKKEGKLILSFKQINANTLLCTVEDNGIGRQKAKEISAKRKGHKSTGINNLLERINLINEAGHIKINYKTIDLFSTDGQAKGTKVEITFSFLKNKKEKKYSINIFGKEFYISIKK